ncbi:nuclear intron maturase 4, mitochondrial isoform X1 [Apium graveolens]|uniref:nuclear intron maturase 4, mitochondrial isoform X1 n=2 Tax=Apium graveolens TaxID=4045 RepID=UPI003D7AE948
MLFAGLRIDLRRFLPKLYAVEAWSVVCLDSSALRVGRLIRKLKCCSVHSTVAAVSTGNKNVTGKINLAKNLAGLLEESSNQNERKPRTRMELKRHFEHCIKRRVKEQYVDGKYYDLMVKVIADPKTLFDAYNSIRVSSNVNLELECDKFPLKELAEELAYGKFDVGANTFSISTRGPGKEVLVLPNLKLKVVQEAIRIALEVVFRPYFSKTSHGCRSGRGHFSALKYIRKEVSNPDWWFTLLVYKQLDACVLSKLIATMETKIEDSTLYAIIRSMFDAHVLNLNFGGFPKGHGLPQEGLLSPILMNIYLDLFDSEVYRLSMRYEAFGTGPHTGQHLSNSKLRSWFRKQIDGNSIQSADLNSNVRIHCCRFMDEIFIAISGPKEAASAFKSEIQCFLHNSLHMDVDNCTDVYPCNGARGVQFLGTMVKRSMKENPAIRTVHKLKDKVRLFALQKQESWNFGTIRIGKKWLAHGLKKVKESEIKHLADPSSVLNRISHFRKAGMESDHWYKALLKIWMQNVNAKSEVSVESVLSKFIAEPALPQELLNSFYAFQKKAEEYIASETAATAALLPESSSVKSPYMTKIYTPVNLIKKRLIRYGLTNSKGHARSCHALILQDNDQIIDWFSGLASRWDRWFGECDDFGKIKIIVSDLVRKSCIRTLAAKYRIHESQIEKQFNSELSRLPSTQEIEDEILSGSSEAQQPNYDEALMYGISFSGLCVLSLTRMVSQSRNCCCFVMGCTAAAPCVYSLHIMERQKFPSWKTGFATCIHPSLNRRRIGLCKQHVKDLYLGHISLSSIDFGAWR